jgi:PAS domain S-box-containing protein
VNETIAMLHTLDCQTGALSLLEKVAANLPGMIFQFLQRQDGSKFLLYASSGCRELYELEPEVLQADFQILLELIHPDDLIAFTESINDAYTKSLSWYWEGRIITHSGTIKWVQATGQPESQANGDVIWQGLVMDITKQKQVEIALWSMTEKFNKAFRSSADSITISTLEEGRYVEVNDSFVRLVGYKQQEIVGKTAFELDIWVNKSDRTFLVEELQSKGVVRNLELEFRQKSGELIITQLSAELIDLEGIPCILAVNHDITKRKHQETQLRLTAQRDRLLTETLARIRNSLNLDQILQTTVEEVRHFLQADRVFIGLSTCRGGGRILAESVDPNYPPVFGCKIEDPTVVEEMQKLLTTQQVRMVEDINYMTGSAKLKEHYQKFQTKATLAVPIMQGDELVGALIANQCSVPRCWQPIEIDLLQQMSQQLAIAIRQAQIYQELAQMNTHLEHQVEQRTAQLQQKMEELGELHHVKNVVLHTISHELKTSVMGNLMVLNNLLSSGAQEQSNGGIQGNNIGSNSSYPPISSPRETPVAFLTGSPSLDPAIPVSPSIIERMIQGNKRQLTMIESLLEIHESVGQGIVLHRETANLKQLLERIIQDLQPMLGQNQGIVVNLVPEALPGVFVDRTRLRQVVENLLTHSLQHNPPGLNFTLKASVQGQMIRVEIQDNGVGMLKKQCDRLFDLYVREPQSCSSTGAGLKLYLCRQIIQAHGGEIGVSSSQKRGLTFWFGLPLAD